ncbi:MAG: aminopeptidase N [Pseudomonadota bacterium]
MQPSTRKTIFLSDYRPPDYFIRHTDLVVELDPINTRVYVTHRVEKNQDDAANTLVLHAENMSVRAVTLNAGESLPFIHENDLLTVDVADREFELSIECIIHPEKNTSLSGLYKSGDMLCTQCEAEGFRRIAPSVDRPDNLATYRTRLIANKSEYPVLLGNGNLEKSGNVEGDSELHFAEWYDPFPKPTYLFALVAGKLNCIRDSFKTNSGRCVDLRFYARGKDSDRCWHGMEALKNSMRWDEEVYGREYDLDLFNVVAVEDFNMGAMENKSLNIFNTKYVLADPDIATDTDFANVEAVVAHEYFHNWSGNRVTCRDWFQLSLKEGFTVFRDQEFSADMGSAGVKRIEDVNGLRNHQFKEDAGPMAHSIRPNSYQEINNFYTATVYEKGAEVVRMLRTLVDNDLFRKGTDLYFERFDGQAVTTDDFVDCISEAADIDLSLFRRWYEQAGTPRLTVDASYDSDGSALDIHFSQRCPDTPGQKNKKPFTIPISLALLSDDNKSEDRLVTHKQLITLQEEKQTVRIDNFDSRPILSVLRNFSAPVILEFDQTPRDLSVLMAKDDDPFNRWDAGQRLMLEFILSDMQSEGVSPELKESILVALERTLRESDDEPALAAKLLTPPAYGFICEHAKPIDPHKILRSRKKLVRSIADHCGELLIERFETTQQRNQRGYSGEVAANRSLRDVCLLLLSQCRHPASEDLINHLRKQATNLTDRCSTMTAAIRSAHPQQADIISEMYENWSHEPLVVDKWLRIQAMEADQNPTQTIRDLSEHEAFNYRNPNKVYSLLLAFSHGNPGGFHSRDGSGQDLIREWVEKIDPVNPQVAARLVSAFNSWRQYQKDTSNFMRQELETLSQISDLSSDVSEIISKALSDT